MSKILLGLDIGTQTIKAVQISQEKGKSRLLSAGYVPTPINILNATSQKEEELLVNALNNLFHEMKISAPDISASLPNSKIITRVVELPQMNEEELSSSINWEAEQFIPLPLAKVKVDYSIISKDEQSGKMKILLVAAPISIIEKYMHIISLVGLNPIAFEPEILATGRSISTSFPALSHMLIFSLGATTAEIALLHNSVLIYTKSYPIGGNTLTRAIAEELGFEPAQAEEYKKTYGLEEDKLEGKIYHAIEPFFRNLFQEMEKTVIYFKEQYPQDELKTVVISGGGAKLPGLVMAITKNLGLDSQISNPFTNLIVHPNILPMLSQDAPLYTTAVGLGLKETE